MLRIRLRSGELRRGKLNIEYLTNDKRPGVSDQKPEARSLTPERWNLISPVHFEFESTDDKGV